MPLYSTDPADLSFAQAWAAILGDLTESDVARICDLNGTTIRAYLEAAHAVAVSAGLTESVDLDRMEDVIEEAGWRARGPVWVAVWVEEKGYTAEAIRTVLDGVPRIRVVIGLDGHYIGEGWWGHGAIVDCPADLPEEDYTALDRALADVL